MGLTTTPVSFDWGSLVYWDYSSQYNWETTEVFEYLNSLNDTYSITDFIDKLYYLKLSDNIPGQLTYQSFTWESEKIFDNNNLTWDSILEPVEKFIVDFSSFNLVKYFNENIITLDELSKLFNRYTPEWTGLTESTVKIISKGFDELINFNEITDTLSLFNKNYSEFIFFEEDFSKIVTFTRSISELINYVDSRYLTFQKNTYETIILNEAESINFIINFIRNFAETSNITEVTNYITSFNRNFNEILNNSDLTPLIFNFEKSINEIITAIDVLTLINFFNRNFNETILQNDNFTYNTLFNRNFNELVNSNDSRYFTVQKDINESLQLNKLVETQVPFTWNSLTYWELSDNIWDSQYETIILNEAESINFIINFIRNFAETSNITEVTNYITSFNRNFNEILNNSDFVSTITTFNRIFLEDIKFDYIISYLKVFYRDFNESLQISNLIPSNIPLSWLYIDTWNSLNIQWDTQYEPFIINTQENISLITLYNRFYSYSINISETTKLYPNKILLEYIIFKDFIISPVTNIPINNLYTFNSYNSYLDSISSLPITYSDWKQFVPGDYVYKKAFVKFDVDIPDLSYNIQINSAKVVSDVYDIDLRGIASIPAAETQIFFSSGSRVDNVTVLFEGFNTLEHVLITRCTPINNVFGVPIITETTNTYFKVKIVDANNNLLAGTIEWKAEGY